MVFAEHSELMKSALASHQSTKSKELSEEKAAFFERAYLALLSSAMSQFEWRNHIGILEVGDEEEEEAPNRIELLVDRAFRMAQEATSRYFDQKDFSSKC